MLNFSIMKPYEDHIEEYCDDIEAQVKQGVATMPLFSMTLTPEGIPAIDKAAMLCAIYEKYKRILDSRGIPSGVLIQASIGHGWKLNEPSAFVKYTNLTDGSTPEVCCPLDEGFRDYIRRAAARIARSEPCHIMLDDDFRLTERAGRGCACPLHMRRFNSIAGTDITREELYRTLNEGGADAEEYRRVFIKTQTDSLIECAREIRAGIDSVDPTLPGSYCLCGNAAEAAYAIASIMAGEGNPVTVRLNNGGYCSSDHRDFTHIMYRAATQIRALGKTPDYILAETDTCPQNRYSTPAARLHAHFIFSILEGARGAKHWITKLSDFQPLSGAAYRKKLCANRPLYEELAAINGELTWLGCRIAVSPVPHYKLTDSDLEISSNGWHSHILDRFGLPLHFSPEGEGVCFLDGRGDRFFTDSELTELLSGKVVMDAPAAESISERGMGKYLGVQVRRRPAQAPNATGEIYPSGGKSKAQFGVRELTPLSDKVKRCSEVYHLRDGRYEDILFPGVTSYKNELGGEAVVFSGNTRFGHNIVDAFGFLDMNRKQQLVDILTDLGALPVYYPDDAEVLMKAARMKDGALLCVLMDMSLDPIEDLPLVIRREVKQIKRLLPDGSYATVDHKRNGDRYTLSLTAQVFDPVILIIK